MRLDRDWIERRIPHHGSMCLLDGVIRWDAERISCTSDSHRALDNPLRAGGQLGIACGIEYAGQAMALHGALISGAGSMPAATAAVGPQSQPAAGFLASVREVRFHVTRLDDVQGPLICDAVRMAGNSGTALYEFELRSGAERLLRGRATVVLDVNGKLSP